MVLFCAQCCDAGVDSGIAMRHPCCLCSISFAAKWFLSLRYEMTRVEIVGKTHHGRSWNSEKMFFVGKFTRDRSHDGSMVRLYIYIYIYMLTWLGYIDGIHVSIYIYIYTSTMDPMGMVPRSCCTLESGCHTCQEGPAQSQRRGHRRRWHVFSRCVSVDNVKEMC